MIEEEKSGSTDNTINQLSIFVDQLFSAFHRLETEESSFQSQINNQQSSIKNHQSKITNLIEPLSDREIEVVRLLAAGLSNLEIAHKLYLSPNTLKAHTQNIYDKLDVHSRVQAVNRARELGYLND